MKCGAPDERLPLRLAEAPARCVSDTAATRRPRSHPGGPVPGADRHGPRALDGCRFSILVLLEDDKRDTDDIPGFDDLADQERALIVRIVGIPATGFAGLLSKAQVARLRPVASGYDGAAPLALSLADDVIRLATTERNKP